ncbi:MAG: type II toxin-antitoxin system prevent-host-death family antitoxin [Propioniciclava sp.]|uniref:type II toxin-antitoxin system Phd/YefM family antitoxin n=1 Tax=Propioniciclava sp. TaxID=2038686 RepID=UPI0039E37F71
MGKVYSSGEFNRNMSTAKQAAKDGPVVITDRGTPAYVLTSIEEYRRMKEHHSIVDILRMDDGDDIEFEPVRIQDLGRAAEF